MTAAPAFVLVVASLLSTHPISSPPLPATTPASLVSVAPLVDHSVDLRRALRSSSTHRGMLTVASPPPTQAVQPKHERPAILSFLGVAAGFVGGALIGGVIGARLEKPCRCDDPGLEGFVWGARIGGVAGAITAGYFLNK